MKKILVITLALLSIGFFSASELKAKESTAAAVITAYSPQQEMMTMRRQTSPARRANDRNGRRAAATKSRLVRVGRRVYRETYRIVYRANGTTRTQLIRRVRVR